jgi:hypothetical protein
MHGTYYNCQGNGFSYIKPRFLLNGGYAKLRKETVTTQVSKKKGKAIPVPGHGGP